MYIYSFSTSYSPNKQLIHNILHAHIFKTPLTVQKNHVIHGFFHGS